ncbi:hypothetical protein DB346_15360 [Verrucomicrobia bacterium LW23]|nr:hypothetical protein DB346_15360 [Verrucomicrobia bacterium LW23]
MSRKQVERSLPPLEKQFADFKGFGPDVVLRSALYDLLLRAASQLRGKRSRPFYAMREVAIHFGLALRTVAIVYYRLEQKGLIYRIRSSKTMLAGSELSPRNPVRALIGIPAFMPAMTFSISYRYMLMELGDRLRHHGFVADFIFFRHQENKDNQFINRLLQHKLDYMIWHTLDAYESELLLSLKDSGVRQILIQQTDQAGSLDIPSYMIDWNAAYRDMADEWFAKGIRTVLVPELDSSFAMRAAKSFSTILGQSGIQVHIAGKDLPELSNQLADRSPKSCAVAFLDQGRTSVICSQQPALLESIVKKYRTALCRGPIPARYFDLRPALIDIVRISPAEIAKRIANDIHTNNIPANGTIHTFRAGYQKRVNFIDAHGMTWGQCR